jgi:hypothetical protein
VLALTKLNYNTCIYGGGLPVGSRTLSGKFCRGAAPAGSPAPAIPLLHLGVPHQTVKALTDLPPSG